MAKKLNRLAGALPIHKLVDGVTLPTAAKCYPRREYPPEVPGELYCECGVTSMVEQWGADGAPNEVGPRCPHCGIQYELDDDGPPKCNRCGAPYRLDESMVCPAWVPNCMCFEAPNEPREAIVDGSAVPEVHEPASALERLRVCREPEPEPEPEPPEHVTADGVIEEPRHLSEEQEGRLLDLNDEWLELTLRLELLESAHRKNCTDYRASKETIAKRVKEIRSEMGAIREGKGYVPPVDDEKALPKQPGLFDGVGGTDAG